MAILTLSDHITSGLHRKFLLEMLDAHDTKLKNEGIDDVERSKGQISEFSKMISKENFEGWLHDVFAKYNLTVRIILDDSDDNSVMVPDVSLELDDEDAVIMKLSSPEYFK